MSLGSSLWLVPPRDGPLRPALQSLISKEVPSLFLSLSTPEFSPHITLTADIPPATYAEDAAAWLGSLQLPAAADVRIKFSAIDTEKPYYRKCTIRVEKSEGLLRLTGESRRRGVERGDEKAALAWLASEYRPHCSLMYARLDMTEQQRSQVEKVVRDNGVDFSGGGDLGGWTGGEVWLVPTEKPIEDWKPIAVRSLSYST